MAFWLIYQSLLPSKLSQLRSTEGSAWSDLRHIIIYNHNCDKCSLMPFAGKPYQNMLHVQCFVICCQLLGGFYQVLLGLGIGFACQIRFSSTVMWMQRPSLLICVKAWLAPQAPAVLVVTFVCKSIPVNITCLFCYTLRHCKTGYIWEGLQFRGRLRMLGLETVLMSCHH